MPYDHSTNIGNQGDVVKHAVLFNCVVDICKRIDEISTFSYAESHCGRAEYVLPEGGKWRDGIGVLSRKSNVLLDAAPTIKAYKNEMFSRNL